MKHPVTSMTHGRAAIWRGTEDEEFMQYLSDLANIYAGKKRLEDTDSSGIPPKLDTMRLFKDYKKWLVDNG